MTPKRILLIDDDPVVRDLCLEVLAGEAHTVVAVDDGAVALEEIRRSPPDLHTKSLVLSDSAAGRSNAAGASAIQ